MSRLKVTQLIEFLDEAKIERVLWDDRHQRGYFLIDINDACALPVFRKADDVAQLLADGYIREVPHDPWRAPLSETTIPAAHRAKRDKAWTVIRPLVEQQPTTFLPHGRAPTVLRIIEESRISRYTLYRLLRRYWQRGMTPNALLPDYDHCGGRGKPRKISSKKRGRPVLSGQEGLNVDSKARDQFRIIITRYYAINKRLNLEDCYYELLDEYYTDLILDETTGHQNAVLRELHPTPAQFRYWYEKDNDIFLIDRKRRTPRVYDKGMRALLSTSAGETIGPASRYQIDATIADIYLVSRMNPSKIVGRPVLYFVVDVFSRMIVGVYVGFEGPSWVSAMMAIANAASDKVTFCNRFGVDITEADWPCRNLPDALLGDRGEMLSSSVETLINNFRVRVENTAPYHADWKGIVEQRFKLIPAAFKAYTPGYVETDFRERGARDYRLDGKLDIDAFTAIIIRCVLYYNNCHQIVGYERDREMVADEVKAIPIELWEWGIARRTGLQRSFPEDLVRLSLLPSNVATVTTHGIRFYGCYYTCPEAIAEHWFERARQKGTWQVRISYDPRHLNDIYLHEETGRVRFVPCTMTDRSAAYRDRTLWEIDQVRQEERAQQNAQAPQVRQGRIDLNRAIKSIVSEAESKQANHLVDPITDRQKVKNIRSNRALERRENQEREKFQSGRNVPPPAKGGKIFSFPSNQPAEGDYGLPSIADILKLKEGGDTDG